MLAQLGARMRSLLRGDQYWEQGPVKEVGAIQLLRRVRERWEFVHNTTAARRFDLRAVLQANDHARAARAAPRLAEADWNVPLPLEWIDAAGRATPLDDAFFALHEYRLESLTGFPDAVFVSMAYRCILKRAPDRTGFQNYLSRLRSGTFDRIDVLRSLVRSSEAEPIGVRIVKLRRLDWWRRAQQVRVVGPLIAWANGLLRLSRLVRRQQVLEAQLEAVRSDTRDETRRITNETTGPLVSSLAALELARAQIEDGLAAIAQVLERLDADSRRQIMEADAQILRVDDRLERLDAVADLGRERLEWVEKRLQPAAHPPAEESASADDASMALLCAEVEARLYGEAVAVRAQIDRRLESVRAAGAGTREAPVLDLGCGRGDWLAAMRADGIEARGVETSGALVHACRDRGLVVDHAEPSRWLATAPAGHFGAVFALHLAEGMPLLDLVHSLRHVHRALRADGLIVIETVGAAGTPTGMDDSRRPVRPSSSIPLTPAVLEYLVASQGFEHISVEEDITVSAGATNGAARYTLLARKTLQASLLNGPSS